MPIRRLQQFLSERFGVSIVRDRYLYPWQVRSGRTADPEGDLPQGASEYLRADNPRLRELVQRYERCPREVTAGTVWRPDKIDVAMLRQFRGDNPYVFQQRMHSGNELSYALSYYHTLATSAGAVLERLNEDGLFGAFGVEIGDRLVTRDLLDSAGEIDFLVRNAGLGRSAKSLLDIGAGYGRLAHRLTEALPEVEVFITDAFPTSTFLSEYYLRFRKTSTTVVPLDEIEALLRERRIDIATNIHSFSECTAEAIAWWASRLADGGVGQLVVIPNMVDERSRCLTNSGQNIEDILARFGYRPTLREMRYRDPVVQRWGVDPSTSVLFELS